LNLTALFDSLLGLSGHCPATCASRAYA